MVKNNCSILVCGDFVPRFQGKTRIDAGDYSCLDNFLSYINDVDYSIVNFESPVVKHNAEKLKKSGPNLSCSEKAIECIKSAGFNCVTLANNHFRDYGQVGVSNTISVCVENRIDYVGGGHNKEEARKPLSININGVKIAVLNACEHEFSIATSTFGGSNPLDLINMQEDITRMKKESDYVIVICHGGIEMYHYPTPRMKRWYRHFVDLGADVVINHHQHCINGYEIYNGKLICYGLGNYYFPGGHDCAEGWQYGYAVKLFFSSQVDFELIPYKQDADGITIRNWEDFDNEIQCYSSILRNDELLQKEFDSFVIKRENYLKTMLFPSFIHYRPITALANRGYFGSLYKGDHLFELKNKITCESHSELLQRLFELKTNY